MSDDIYKDLKQLGGEARIPQSPDAAMLERVANPQADVTYNVRFTAPEFTSLCPMTGQPDFAHLVIDYVPAEWLVEAKSLKLYLTSFRNHGAFHEDCTLTIARKLVDFLRPHWLRIGGYWYPRGGIPIDVFWQTGAMPDGVWIPRPRRAALPRPRLTPIPAASSTASCSTDLDVPWDMAFVDEDTMFFTEQCAGLSVRMPDGTVNALYGVGETEGYPATEMICSARGRPG